MAAPTRTEASIAPVLMDPRAVTLHPHLLHVLRCATSEVVASLLDALDEASKHQDSPQMYDTYMDCNCWEDGR